MSSRPLDDEHDPVNDDEIDIHLRAPTDVAARILVLASVCRYVGLRASPTPSAATDDIAAARFDLRSWLTLEGLSGAVVPTEARLLERDASTLAPDELSAITWRAEALVALGWALALVPELPPPDQPTDPSSLLAGLPQPYDATDSFRRQTSLRPEPEIAHERERAEVWHWRSDLADLQASASAGERRELAALVRDVTREATASGLISGSRAEDFVVAGRPFLTLPAADRELIAIVAEQRLHALNWLCGFGQDWDSVPLDC